MCPTRRLAAMLPVRRCAAPRLCWAPPGNPGSPKLPVLTSAAAASAACCASALAASPCRCSSAAAVAAAAASAAAASSRCACSSAHWCLSRLVTVGAERSSSRPLMISWNSLGGATRHHAECTAGWSTAPAGRIAALSQRPSSARAPTCKLPSAPAPHQGTRHAEWLTHRLQWPPHHRTPPAHRQACLQRCSVAAQPMENRS